MKELLGFLVRRMGWMVLTLWAVYTVSFILMKLIPGSPFSGERAMPAAIEQQMRARYNLDAPAIQQYWEYLWGILSRGDLSWSIETQWPGAVTVLGLTLDPGVLVCQGFLVIFP